MIRGRDLRTAYGQRSQLSTIVHATDACISHQWSAGITYHGAHGVEVAVIASSNARTYSSKRARSATSAALHFHSSPNLSSRARNPSLSVAWRNWY
jgi:hypothetical protein